MVVVSLQFLWGYENPFPNGLNINGLYIGVTTVNTY